MRLVRVDVLRSPGISPGFHVEGFADGLTIIQGRNESGKSTLASAVRELLWPGPHSTLQARGVFTSGEHEYHAFVDIHGGGWQGEAPRLPQAAAARSLVVGIGDLWREGEHDRALREAMAREINGGYDLEPLRASAERKSPTGPQRDLREAEAALDAARTEARTLMAQQARLPELRNQAKLARQRADQRHLVEAALQRLDATAEQAEDEHRRAGLPAGAFRVAGDEAEQLTRLDRACKEHQHRARAERDAADRANRAIAELDLPAHGVDPADLELLGTKLAEAVSLEQQVRHARGETARRQAEAEAVGHDGEPLGREALDRLDEALLRAQEARERLARDRIAAEQGPPPPPRTARGWHAGTLAAIALACIAAGLASAWLALGLMLVALVLGMIALVRTHGPAIDDAPRLSEQAERSERAYQEKLQAIRTIAGDDGELSSTLSLVVAARRAERQDEKRLEWLGSRAGVEALQEQLDGVLEDARRVLATYGGEPCQSVDDLARRVEALKRRSEAHRRHTENATRATTRASEDEHRAETARQDYQRFLERIGLRKDQLGELHEWLRLRTAATELRDRMRDRHAYLQRLDATLAEVPELLELDRASLEARLHACEQAEQDASSIEREIGGIERDVERLKRATNVAEAIGRVERAARAVAQARDHECAKAARRLILAHATTSMQRDDLPELVRTADRWLARFTRNAYGLHVDEAGEPVVHDARSGTAKTDEQLSTGTRAQALLATRLAGAIEAERRADADPLPLVLDEPLATTDEARFEAITAAMFELARGGRQLVYLTCEPAHAARLEQLADQSGITCVMHDLDAIRGRQGAERLPAGAWLEPKPMPSPEHLSRQAYLDARGVTPVDPWASPDAIDLYHLLADDLDLLHELDRHGLAAVGQVRAEHRRRGKGFAWPNVAASAGMVHRLVQAWRRGRARPVTTRDLLDSGVVSDVFLPRLADVNDDLGGSAEALMDALEARGDQRDERLKGFQTAKVRALREFLEQRALLPARPPADRPEVLSAAIHGVEVGISDQERGRLLETANRVLDAIEAAAEPASEAPGPARA